MRTTSSPLARHLGLVLAVKVALLALLWAAFVRGDSVSVDAAAMAARAGVPATPPPSTQGEHRE